MKKTALLLACIAGSLLADAQLSLTGTTYSQNFNGIGSGLPTGWSVHAGSSSTFIGTIETFTGATFPPSVLRPDTGCIGGVNVGGFKNFPSATVSHPGDDYCATVPPSYSNRALGVRQVSPTNTSHPNLDSGAAYVLELANTTGLYNFRLAFNLQSLDTSSARATTWLVDYAIGSPTSFTPATTTTGVFTTGGHAFSNNICTVNFLHALDNATTPVYLRIVTLVYSSGTGNRPSTAIDDFNLTWSTSPGTVPTTGITEVSAQPSVMLNTIGMATSDKVVLSCNTEAAGTYNLSVYDVTGRILRSESINLQEGEQKINVEGMHLAPAMYIAKISNGNTSAVARISVQ